MKISCELAFSQDFSLLNFVFESHKIVYDTLTFSKFVLTVSAVPSHHSRGCAISLKSSTNVYMFMRFLPNVGFKDKNSLASSSNCASLTHSGSLCDVLKVSAILSVLSGEHYI